MSFSYDAFASHATDPDGALVRAVEARIETFHNRYGVTEKYRRKLELCVDGRDFVSSRRDRNSETGGAIIECAPACNFDPLPGVIGAQF